MSFFYQPFKKGVSTEKIELRNENNELLVYKYLKTTSKFHRELRAYRLLEYCEFVPELVNYYELSKLIVTKYVGESLNLKYLPKDRKKFKPEIQKINNHLIQHYGIHHNDIRWKNIVESPNGKLFVIDFESWTPAEIGSKERDPEKILS